MSFMHILYCVLFVLCLYHFAYAEVEARVRYALLFYHFVFVETKLKAIYYRIGACIRGSPVNRRHVEFGICFACLLVPIFECIMDIFC